MSKQIDPTQPLSDEDREYLVTRGQEVHIARIDGGDFVAAEPKSETDEGKYGKMLVDELRAELADRELDDDGLKAELVARLEASDLAQDSD